MLDADAVRATQRLISKGFEAYLVGGCVRDLLLGRSPKDYDIATEARPPQVKRVFPRNCRIIGRRFKLAHLHFHGNTKILECSTFRRTPQQLENGGDDVLITHDNEFGTAEEDAMRRDFTVNALFLDPTRDTILDYTDGLQDVRDRVIRTIGDPIVRFREDPVRILRAAKFAGRLGFSVEAETLAAMAETSGDLVRSAPPRVFEEILRLLRGGHSLDSFQLLRDVGALKSLVPVVADFLAIADHDERVDFWHLLYALDQRVLDGFMPPSGVLLGALLVGPVLAKVARNPGRSASSVAEELLGPLCAQLRLPKRDAGCLKRICGVQHRFLQPDDSKRFRIEGFLHGPYFFEALALFEMRMESRGEHRTDEESASLAHWRDLADQIEPAFDDDRRGPPDEANEPEAPSEPSSDRGAARRGFGAVPGPVDDDAEEPHGSEDATADDATADDRKAAPADRDVGAAEADVRRLPRRRPAPPRDEHAISETRAGKAPVDAPHGGLDDDASSSDRSADLGDEGPETLGEGTGTLGEGSGEGEPGGGERRRRRRRRRRRGGRDHDQANAATPGDSAEDREPSPDAAPAGHSSPAGRSVPTRSAPSRSVPTRSAPIEPDDDGTDAPASVRTQPVTSDFVHPEGAEDTLDTGLDAELAENEGDVDVDAVANRGRAAAGEPSEGVDTADGDQPTPPGSDGEPQEPGGRRRRRRRRRRRGGGNAEGGPFPPSQEPAPHGEAVDAEHAEHDAPPRPAFVRDPSAPLPGSNDEGNETSNDGGPSEHAAFDGPQGDGDESGTASADGTIDGQQAGEGERSGRRRRRRRRGGRNRDGGGESGPSQQQPQQPARSQHPQPQAQRGPSQQQPRRQGNQGQQQGHQQQGHQQQGHQQPGRGQQGQGQGRRDQGGRDPARRDQGGRDQGGRDQGGGGDRRRDRRPGVPRDVDVVPRYRDRRGKVDVIEPTALDLSAFDVELDPKRVPTFGSIVEGKGRPKRRSPRVPEDGVDDYRPPPPPGGDSGPTAPPPPPPADTPDTFGDW